MTLLSLPYFTLISAVEETLGDGASQHLSLLRVVLLDGEEYAEVARFVKEGRVR